MPYEYEVALSFAGEDRPFAEEVAKGLEASGVRVFYDDFYADELWGQDLAVKLREIYHSSSQFCIMIISEPYVRKMWPSHERQQAIERMIQQQGQTYILPVRLNRYNGEVPGLSGSISYLAADSNNPQIVVDTFLRKIGREKTQVKSQAHKQQTPKHTIPRIKKSFTDKEKNHFLKSSFNEIVNLIDEFATATKQQYSHFDYDREDITSRKVLFTLYTNEKQATQFKIWIGGMFGDNSIAFSYGHNIEVGNDGSMNESLSVKEHEGQLVLKPMGMGLLGAKKDSPLSPKEAADYLWELSCRNL